MKKNIVRNLDIALDLIHKAGQDSGHNFNAWIEADLTDHLVMLAHMYSGHALLSALVKYLKEEHSIRLENLQDYDLVTGLDEFGETNELDKEGEEFDRLSLSDLEPAL
jgi:hypothetical protein